MKNPAWIWVALSVAACANRTTSDAADADAPAPSTVDSGSIASDARVPDAAPADATRDAAMAEAAAPADATRDAAMAEAAAPADASAVDAARPDAGAADSGVCTPPALMIDGPFSTAPVPATAHLLLTDNTSNEIFLLQLDGTMLNRFTSPEPGVYGVAHDRRAPDGFWVDVDRRRANHSFYKLDFTGVVRATLTYSETSSDRPRGMDFAFGTTPANDVLVFPYVNRNDIDTVSGAKVIDGSRWFEGGIIDEGTIYNGMHVERYACDDANTLVYWTTTGNTLLLRDWSMAVSLRTIVLPTTDARGVTRTPRGDFFVVDGANHRVLHLDPTGAMIGSFATPGSDPVDLSYGEVMAHE